MKVLTFVVLIGSLLVALTTAKPQGYHHGDVEHQSWPYEASDGQQKMGQQPMTAEGSNGKDPIFCADPHIFYMRV